MRHSHPQHHKHSDPRSRRIDWITVIGIGAAALVGLAVLALADAVFLESRLLSLIWSNQAQPHAVKQAPVTLPPLPQTLGGQSAGTATPTTAPVIAPYDLCVTTIEEKYFPSTLLNSATNTLTTLDVKPTADSLRRDQKALESCLASKRSAFWRVMSVPISTGTNSDIRTALTKAVANNLLVWGDTQALRIVQPPLSTAPGVDVGTQTSVAGLDEQIASLRRDFDDHKKTIAETIQARLSELDQSQARGPSTIVHWFILVVLIWIAVCFSWIAYVIYAAQIEDRFGIKTRLETSFDQVVRVLSETSRGQQQILAESARLPDAIVKAVDRLIAEIARATVGPAPASQSGSEQGGVQRADPSPPILFQPSDCPTSYQQPRRPDGFTGQDAIADYRMLVAKEDIPSKPLEWFKEQYLAKPAEQTSSGWYHLKLTEGDTESAMMWILLGAKKDGVYPVVLTPRAYSPVARESRSTRLVQAIDHFFELSDTTGVRVSMSKEAWVRQIQDRGLYEKYSKGAVQA